MENEKEKIQEDGTSGIWEDSRFSHLVSDPRFKSLPNFQRKVKIDKRFQSMFSDKKFKIKYSVDKYGRKVNQSTTEDLKKYYALDSSAEEEDEEKEEIEKREEELAIARHDDDDEEESRKIRIASVSDIDETDVKDASKSIREMLIDPEIDYARGEGAQLTDSSLDDESSEDDDAELYIEHVWGEIDNDAEKTDESTRRLAVCNMDWDRIRAQDIMVVCSSFVPPGGSILSVKIYTSEYGRKRLAEEEKHGPQELVQSSKEQKKRKESNDSDSEEDLVQEQDSEAEEGDEYHMEKLRQYQLNRLRYYYAVIECDSVTTADKLYQECDGLEYESTATKMDLRFIPEDTTFDEEEPKDVCTEMPDLNQYKPRSFTTTALQQAKVDLTWDETSIERKELGEKLITGKLEEVNDADLRKFVAYSSEEDNDDDASDKDEGQENETNKPKAEQTQDDKHKNGKNTKDSISKYKALLFEIEENEKKEKRNKLGMEFSWDINAENENSENDEQEIENAASNLTPIEKVLKKRSEKNKKRKEDRKKKKREAAGKDEMGDEDSDSDIPDDIDMHDPYFAEEFANGDFIQPKSKKDKSKKKKKNAKNQEDADDEEAAKKEQELQLLLDDSNENDVGKKHFSLEKIIEAENETKSKRRRKKQLKKSKSATAQSKANQNDEFEDDFSINVDDKRFAAIYSSHLFNIDPTDSHYKKTKGMETLIHEKLKRRHGDDDAAGSNRQTEEEIAQIKKPKKQIENSLLAKSIKRKILNKSN